MVQLAQNGHGLCAIRRALNEIAQKKETVQAQELQGLCHPAPVIQFPKDLQCLLMIGQRLSRPTAIRMPVADTFETLREECVVLYRTREVQRAAEIAAC